MNNFRRMITVGLTTAWDMRCKVEGIDWGDHKTVQSYTKEPAGKSLNINKALAYMGRKSIAAGLWSENDYRLMLEKLEPFAEFIDVKLTPAQGNTRTNITIEDTKNGRHLHLRFPDEICSANNLKKIAEQLDSIVQENDICVFAGSMPKSELLKNVLEVIKVCSDKKAKIAIDTSGESFQRIVNAGNISLISPNIHELSELLGSKIQDDPKEIAGASRTLLNKVETILVSRGKLGAMAITADAVFSCTLTGTPRQAASEVGCGDHFLAGFIAGLEEYPQSAQNALEKGVKLATAHAWGLTKTSKMTEIDKTVKVETQKI